MSTFLDCECLVKMDDQEKKNLIESVVSILKEDFSTEFCGKHDSFSLGCISCQAAIVVNWLEDACNFYEE